MKITILKNSDYALNIATSGYYLSNLTRAPQGYLAERPPLGRGGGKFCPLPCLRVAAARRARRQSKLPMSAYITLKKYLKVTCQVKVRSKAMIVTLRLVGLSET